jgi:tetratricopeptide (TPR) repeat protein
LEAKYYFEMGDYTKAEKLAKEAYLLDPYNRMAFSILTQSKIAKSWENFNKDFEKYFKRIKEISNKEVISDKDKERIKIMLEILLDEHKNLKPSLLLPKKLKEKTKQNYEKVKEIYERVFKK